MVRTQKSGYSQAASSLDHLPHLLPTPNLIEGILLVLLIGGPCRI